MLCVKLVMEADGRVIEVIVEFSGPLSTVAMGGVED